ncbi:MAG TPA: tRNA (adenosine(37)-N6)-dimethylallyltransferase MiaA [Candidatus Dojkabacteria bacterium]|nr:tRNA (adenosine(37)-N6)-dimethylallyltransferase MiaA [Candidatus Dojkabacteria bacterium]
MIKYKGKIIVIAGATATGKSEISLKLAKELNGYIINADSRQIYKKINIGSAKPKFDKEISKGVHTLNGITHYLYDFVDPKENFTIFDYQNCVNNVLKNTQGIPILTGGSGLYIDSVIYNYKLSKNNKNTDLKDKSIEELQELAKEYLPYMSESDRKNKHRLIRAIQREGVNREKGKELNNIYFVIDIEKQVLQERIKKRIDNMFKEGLLEENISLLKQGYTYNDKGMKTIGYIEFKEYFENKISLEDVKERIFKNTMGYVKRQRTWFKRNKNAVWINEPKEILYLASNFILKE